MNFLKSLLSLCIMLAVTASCDSSSKVETEYKIEGEIIGLGNSLLSFRIPGKNYDTLSYWADTIVVTNDKFSYTGNTESKELIRFFVRNDEIMKTVPGGGYYPTPSNMLFAFVEPGAEIKVNGKISDFVDAYPSGTPSNDELAKLHKEIYPILNESVNLMVKAAHVEDEAAKEPFYKESEKIGEKATEVKKEYIKNNTSSAVSAWYLSDMMVRSQVTEQEAIDAFNSLDKSLNELASYQDLENRIAGIMTTKEGQPFPSLVTSSTPGGAEFDLASFKGKYVMVDFWGVWCGPCVSEMPQVKEFAEKYKDKLEILGVNSGDTEERMMSFLEKNGYDWQQIMSQDGNSVDNFVTKYNVQGFPTKFILDPEGNIVKKYLGSGEEAFALLESLLN